VNAKNSKIKKHETTIRFRCFNAASDSSYFALYISSSFSDWWKMSSLREQFEAWGQERFPETWEMDARLIVQEKINLWQAYQAGYAASGRDELLDALESIVGEDKEYPLIDYDLIVKANAAIKKARGES
jgi:hypothetical protein